LRYGDINNELGEQIELFEPTIDETVECPERFFDVTDSDIETFRKQKLEKEKAVAASKKSSSMMGSKKQQPVADDQSG